MADDDTTTLDEALGYNDGDDGGSGGFLGTVGSVFDQATSTIAGAIPGGADGGADGGGGGSSLPSWLKPLQGYTDFLVTFAKNPRQVVLGIVASTLVSGVLGLLTPVLDAVSLAFFGSDVGSTSGLLGLADIPLLGLELLIDVGAAIGVPVLGLIRGLGDWAATTASALGPLAWPAGVAAGVATIVVAEIVITEVGPAAVSALPVVGSPLSRLLEAITP